MIGAILGILNKLMEFVLLKIRERQDDWHLKRYLKKKAKLDKAVLDRDRDAINRDVDELLRKLRYRRAKRPGDHPDGTWRD